MTQPQIIKESESNLYLIIERLEGYLWQIINKHKSSYYLVGRPPF